MVSYKITFQMPNKSLGVSLLVRQRFQPYIFVLSVYNNYFKPLKSHMSGKLFKSVVHKLLLRGLI